MLETKSFRNFSSRQHFCFAMSQLYAALPKYMAQPKHIKPSTWEISLCACSTVLA